MQSNQTVVLKVYRKWDITSKIYLPLVWQALDFLYFLTTNFKKENNSISNALERDCKRGINE